MEEMAPVAELVKVFEGEFSRPSFKNFGYLLLKWLQGPERAKITELLLLEGSQPRELGLEEVEEKHISALYHFFSRARWSMRSLCRSMFEQVEGLLDRDEVELIVDDTLFKRRGAFIRGLGVHHDPLAFRQSRKGKTSTTTRSGATAPGLNFVVVAVWIPMPGTSAGGMAWPLLFELYRSRSQCPEELYRSQTQIASDLLAIARDWLGERRIVCLGDSQYACEPVLTTLSPNVDMIGPLPKDARLYETYLSWWPGKSGRRPTWGPRAPSPRELVCDESIPWRKVRLKLYGGREVEMLVKEAIVIWRSAGPERILKVVVTRDPKGRQPRDGYFFSTDSLLSAEDILLRYAKRWAIESCFRELKQNFKLETMQLGFERGCQRRHRPRGPSANIHAEPTASRRFVGLAFFAYSFTLLFYTRHGLAIDDILRARKRSPWYRHKTHISFNDMLRTLRRALRREARFQNTHDIPRPHETPTPVQQSYECAA